MKRITKAITAVMVAILSTCTSPVHAGTDISNITPSVDEIPALWVLALDKGKLLVLTPDQAGCDSESFRAVVITTTLPVHGCYIVQENTVYLRLTGPKASAYALPVPMFSKVERGVRV